MIPFLDDDDVLHATHRCFWVPLDIYGQPSGHHVPEWSDSPYDEIATPCGLCWPDGEGPSA